MSTVYQVDLLEDSAFVVRARVQNVDQSAYLQRADLSTITRRVFDVDGNAVVTGHDGASETVASVISDTLQTTSDDAGWTMDDTGYNFKATVAHTALPTGNDNKYLLSFRFTDTNSNQWDGITIDITSLSTAGD